MTIEHGSRRQFSYVPEVTFGTTPGTPSMKTLRTLATGGINPSKQTFKSEELRKDRQITDLRHGHHNPTGTIPFELSYGALDAWIEMALGGTWTTDVLKAGTTLRSASVQEELATISKFIVSTGVVVNTMSLAIRPNAMVTGSFGVLAKLVDTADTTLGAATDVATNEPFDSFTGSLSEGGSPIAIVTALEFNLNNNIDPALVLMSNTAAQMLNGDSDITGTMTCYIQDMVLLEKFLNETESSIEVTLTDPAGNDLTIELPRIKYTGAPINRSDKQLTVNLPFQALRNSADASNIVITRAPAA